MPPRRRAGSRTGYLSPALIEALVAEEHRIRELPGATIRAKAVGDFYAALDGELTRIAFIRIQAVLAMRRSGMTQRAIGRALGLSRPRVGQILKDPRNE